LPPTSRSADYSPHRAKALGRRHLDHTAAAALLAAGLLTLTVGCATAPATPLQEAHDRAVRRLSGQCLREHYDERRVLGGYPVFTACRRWAEDRLRVRMPANARVSLD
jgi:hypothetical protein